MCLIGLTLLVVPLSHSAGGDDDFDWEDELSTAEAMLSINEDSATGAPQQNVVNGWHDHRLSAIEMAQSSEIYKQHEVSQWLLVILGVGLLGDRVLSLWGRPRPASTHVVTPTPATAEATGEPSRREDWNRQ